MYASKDAHAKRRSLVKSYSFGSSFTRCFGGSASPSYGAALMVDNVSYSKLGSSEEEDEGENEEVPAGEKAAPAAAKKASTRGGGGGGAGRTKMGAAGSSSELESSNSPSPSLEHSSFGAKVRLACEQMLETAKKSSPHLSELFVGTQLLMKVTSAAPSRPSSCTHHSLSPSPGFVDSSRIT